MTMKYSKETRELMRKLEELKEAIDASERADEDRHYEIDSARERLSCELNPMGFKLTEINPIDLDAEKDDVSIQFEKDGIYCTLWCDEIITLTDLSSDKDVEIYKVDMYSYNYDSYRKKSEMVSKLEQYLNKI